VLRAVLTTVQERALDEIQYAYLAPPLLVYAVNDPEDQHRQFGLSMHTFVNWLFLSSGLRLPTLTKRLRCCVLPRVCFR